MRLSNSTMTDQAQSKVAIEPDQGFYLLAATRQCIHAWTSPKSPTPSKTDTISRTSATSMSKTSVERDIERIPNNDVEFEVVLRGEQDNDTHVESGVTKDSGIEVNTNSGTVDAKVENASNDSSPCQPVEPHPVSEPSRSTAVPEKQNNDSHTENSDKQDRNIEVKPEPDRVNAMVEKTSTGSSSPFTAGLKQKENHSHVDNGDTQDRHTEGKADTGTVNRKDENTSYDSSSSCSSVKPNPFSEPPRFTPGPTSAKVKSSSTSPSNPFATPSSTSTSQKPFDFNLKPAPNNAREQNKDSHVESRNIQDSHTKVGTGTNTVDAKVEKAPIDPSSSCSPVKPNPFSEPFRFTSGPNSVTWKSSSSSTSNPFGAMSSTSTSQNPFAFNLKHTRNNASEQSNDSHVLTANPQDRHTTVGTGTGTVDAKVEKASNDSSSSCSTVKPNPFSEPFRFTSGPNLPEWKSSSNSTSNPFEQRAADTPVNSAPANRFAVFHTKPKSPSNPFTSISRSTSNVAHSNLKPESMQQRESESTTSSPKSNSHRENQKNYTTTVHDRPSSSSSPSSSVTSPFTFPPSPETSPSSTSTRLSDSFTTAIAADTDTSKQMVPYGKDEISAVDKRVALLEAANSQMILRENERVAEMNKLREVNELLVERVSAEVRRALANSQVLDRFRQRVDELERRVEQLTVRNTTPRRPSRTSRYDDDNDNDDDDDEIDISTQRGQGRRVIVTATGRCYHYDMNCWGLRNARTARWTNQPSSHLVPCSICA